MVFPVCVYVCVYCVPERVCTAIACAHKEGTTEFVQLATVSI